VHLLKQHIDKIQSYYDNDSTPCGGSFTDVTYEIPMEKSINIYPNPANNILNIDYSVSSNSALFEIYNISGQLVQSGNLSKGKTRKIDVSDYNSGIYFIRIHSDEEVISRKIVVY
jgi:hypothetical protein